MSIIKSGSLFATVAGIALCGLSVTALADGYDKGSLKDEAPAETKRELQISGNFAATTDYVFRGFSQSASRPAVQAGIDATYKWFYVGTWSSLIDFGRVGVKDVAHAEVDYYAGIKPVLGPVTMDLGVIYYTYPSAFDPGAELDYVELKIGGSFSPWKDASVGLTFFYSPEYTGKTGDVYTIEGTFAQSFAAIRNVTPSISGTLGYQSGDTLAYRAVFGNGSDDYLYWNVGLGLGFGDNLSLDFRYWDTNVKDNNAAGGFSDGFCSARLFGCDERFVATIKYTLSP
ncbi:MAG: TorF family putative porin [Hyphomicrobiaceae bacterium]